MPPDRPVYSVLANTATSFLKNSHRAESTPTVSSASAWLEFVPLRTALSKADEEFAIQNKSFKGLRRAIPSTWLENRVKSDFARIARISLF